MYGNERNNVEMGVLYKIEVKAEIDSKDRNELMRLRNLRF